MVGATHYYVLNKVLTWISHSITVGFLVHCQEVFYSSMYLDAKLQKF